MYIAKTVKELTDSLMQERKTGKTLGLVPTMGALHAGHASLVQRSVKENDVTIVSIFVNPTQFNDKNDLDNYPRTLEADAKLWETLGVDYIFAPSVKDVYPKPDTRHFDYPPITSVMEGPRRPGHFNGVCQIVSKLFGIVRPDNAYFGEKDFQQIAVIRAMVEELKIPVEIRQCPIVREETGLALSSRNTLLSKAERDLAVNISRVLFISVDYARNHSVKETQNFVVNTLNALQGLEVEYFEIVDAKTLQKVVSWEDSANIQGCITVYCGQKPIRLIDNINYKG